METIINMKLFSIFKKKEKKVNPEQLIVSTFDSNYKKLLDELTLDEYCWDKPFGIKKFECFILAKFVTDYSFNTLYAEELDKDQSEGFQRLCDAHFIEQHDIIFNGMLKFIDMETIINEKIESYKTLRRENRPPECWYEIYSHFSGNLTFDEANEEVERQTGGLELVKSNTKFKKLVPQCELKLEQTKALAKAFMSAEVIFPRTVRFSKSEFKKINLKKIKAAVKKLDKAEKKKEKKKK